MTKKEAELEQAKRDDDLRRVMSTPEGRRFTWRIITSVSGVFRDAFDLNQRVTDRALGAQSVGRALIADCQRVAPREYMAMVNERTNAEVLAIEKSRADAAPSGDTSTAG